MKQWIEQLKELSIGTIIEDEPLKKHTTWKIGGPADAFIEPKDKESLIKVLKVLKEYNVAWKVIGKGSNLLVLDGGFRGAIIYLDKGFQSVTFNGSYINVGASTSIIRLANVSARHGLTGLEFAGGIPGSVGGAIYMNAGAHGSDISNVLIEAEVLLDNGNIEKWQNEDFKFEYRNSVLQKKEAIIISAVFKLEPGNRKIISRDMASYKDRRRKTQPYHLPCSGSVFRNPIKDYAGRLIEELGLKGYQIGGAQISDLHANFIVNTGQASANNVITLINDVKKKVYDAYKIDLIPEVEIVGEE